MTRHHTTESALVWDCHNSWRTELETGRNRWGSRVGAFSL